MKIDLQIMAYGGSKKVQLELTSEKNPKNTITFHSYYFKDVQMVEELIKEIDETDIKGTV